MSGFQLAVPARSWQRDCDVVVVGSGAAGLATALHLAAAGRRVLVVTRAGTTDSATDWAQGGLAAVWASDDSAEQHVEDTLVAGAGLCDEQSVRVLVAEAPEVVRHLMGLGARFDRTPDGRVDLHLEGGHRARRILHSGGDRSGHEVESTLCAALARQDPSPEVLQGQRLVDVLTDASGAACGVRVIDAAGVVGEVLARAVVLATGGIGQLWPTTSNPDVATGDGLAAALRAGAVARDVEFMQFHPTVLVVPPAFRRRGDRGVLVSEAVRGEGALLVDHTGRRVMAGVHPLGDLAPRDVVSAAEQAHMDRTGESSLLLDATTFGAARWEGCFPSILAMCRERGVDPVHEPIPVRPGAHYHCGGVAARMDGRSSTAGLLAVGEVACTGVQGANRLASNSVTEAMVVAGRAARLLAGDLPRPGAPVQRTPLPLPGGGGLVALRDAMQQHVGVLRDASGLQTALGLSAEAASHPAEVAGLAGGLDAANMSLVARAVATAASVRTESRGCHRRSDHPGEIEAWRVHVDLGIEEAGRIAVRREKSEGEAA